MTIAVVVAAAWVAGAVVSATTATIDPAGTEVALRVRLGQRVDRWQIAVHDGDTPGVVRVELQQGPSQTISRTVQLRGTTIEDRSRELAVALALVIEQESPGVASPPRTDPPPRSRVESAAPVAPTGWLAVAGRVAMGRPPDPDGGLGLRGGVTWGREFVQPLAVLGWTHAQRDGLRIDGVRFGVGVAAGAPFARGAFWAGGSVVPQFAWATARDRTRTSGASSTTEVAALLQARWPAWLLGLRLGAEVTAPPLRAIGERGRLRLGTLRFLVGLELGFRMAEGPKRRRG